MDVVDRKELFEAKKALTEFLSKHPHLKEMQKEIESELNKAGCQENRLVIMANIIQDFLEKYAKILRQL